MILQPCTKKSKGLLYLLIEYKILENNLLYYWHEDFEILAVLRDSIQ